MHMLILFPKLTQSKASFLKRLTHALQGKYDLLLFVMYNLLIRAKFWTLSQPSVLSKIIMFYMQQNIGITTIAITLRMTSLFLKLKRWWRERMNMRNELEIKL